MQALIAVKAHKARCLKILTLARKSLEAEADKLLEIFSNMGMTQPKDFSGISLVRNSVHQTTLDNSPGEPFTPSPTGTDMKRNTLSLFLVAI
jgi:hypothetical protein